MQAQKSKVAPKVERPEKTNDAPEVAVVAANLQRLLAFAADRPELGLAGSKLALEETALLVRAHITRILKRRVAVGVDLLGRLARAYGLEAWELLLPHLNPDDPRVTMRLRPGRRVRAAHEANEVIDFLARDSQKTAARIANKQGRNEVRRPRDHPVSRRKPRTADGKKGNPPPRR